MRGQHELVLGNSADGPITLCKEARDVHLHVTGLSRQGKSYFLEHCIRQDIRAGKGVCIIDPHGEMYLNLVRWLAANEMHKLRRIHLINPAAGEWSVGFNPLCIADGNIKARVGAMIEGCQKVWEDTESTGHKTLANLLEMVFSTLAHHRLSLREARLLTSYDNKKTRQQLVSETGDLDLQSDWAELDHLKPQEFVQTFSSVTNRLRALTRSPGVSTMLAQTKDVIDFKTCMDHGHIVLVNLADKGSVPPMVSKTVGALITADLYHSAKTRDTDTAAERPFYCYIDECGSYLNETIVRGLDETAKFGLHYVLSHQRLSQLGKPDDPIREGVMAGAQSKIVFLQDDSGTAAEMGELLFGKAFDFEKPKQVLIKPTVVGYSREWLQAEATADGQFEGSTVGLSNSTGSGEIVSDVDDPTARLVSSAGSNNSEGRNWGTSAVSSRSSHEALIPILEDLPTGVYSIDELKHQAKVEIRLLQKRQAFAYRANDRQPIQFVTADVHPAYPTSDQLDAFFDTIGAREPSAKSVEMVEQAVSERHESMLTREGSIDSSPGDFWE